MGNFKYKTFENFINEKRNDSVKNVKNLRKEADAKDKEREAKRVAEERAHNKILNKLAGDYKRFLKGMGKQVAQREDLLEDGNVTKEIKSEIEKIFKQFNLTPSLEMLSKIYDK